MLGWNRWERVNHVRVCCGMSYQLNGLGPYCSASESINEGTSFEGAPLGTLALRLAVGLRARARLQGDSLRMV